MKKIIFTLAVLMLVTPVGVSACAIAPFEPAGTTVEPAGLSQALIVWREGIENLILDPKLKGNAKDFGLAFAFPSRPEVTEADPALFNELSEFTKPRVPVHFEEGETRVYGFGAAGAAPEASAPPVTVVEEKDVGDYSIAVLQATDAGALISWLKENNYQFTDDDRANVDYYVQKKDYYFVVLKMRPEGAEAAEKPLYVVSDFNFTPIKFEFKVQQPLLPSRLARDNDPVQDFRIYTLSENAVVVPGAATPFAQKIDTSDLYSNTPSITPYYDGAGWLVKLDMKIDPSKIEHDLLLSEWKNPEEFHMTDEEYPRLVLADQIQKGSGILRARAEELRFDGSPEEKPVQFIEGPYEPEPIPWYEEDWARGLFALVIMLILHLYIGAALFTLTKRIGVRHRWRAWLPVFNLHLLINLSGKRWSWLAWLFAIPLIAGTISSLAMEALWYSYAPNEIGEFFLPLVVILLFFLEYTLIDRVITGLVVRCGRPAWWGPLAILVPPVGFLLFGIMAWSKKS